MTFHAMTERYEEITVCGKPALFTSIRIFLFLKSSDSSVYFHLQITRYLFYDHLVTNQIPSFYYNFYQSLHNIVSVIIKRNITMIRIRDI